VGSTKEVHFVDAADGGYALAAQQMKKQMIPENLPGKTDKVDFMQL